MGSSARRSSSLSQPAEEADAADAVFAFDAVFVADTDFALADDRPRRWGILSLSYSRQTVSTGTLGFVSHRESSLSIYRSEN